MRTEILCGFQKKRDWLGERRNGEDFKVSLQEMSDAVSDWIQFISE
jgi:hypothetical protein